MIITVDEARAYWSDPSQHEHGKDESALTDDFVYTAKDGVCLAFHPVLLPDVWAVHIGVKREAWGHTDAPTANLLAEFWDVNQPRRIIAWIEDHKRHATALARRVGFVEDGRFPGVTLLGWSN